MCHSESETALRILQVQRLRNLIKTALVCSGVLFLLVGLNAIVLHERLPGAPSYRFIFGFSVLTWWSWVAFAWGVVFFASGCFLVLAGTKYPHRLRQAMALGTLLTCWWTAGLLVEASWSQITHRGEMPTLYPLFSWAAWAVQFLLLNRIPRVAPVGEDEIHLFQDAIVPPTQEDVDRALHGDVES